MLRTPSILLFVCAMFLSNRSSFAQGLSCETATAVVANTLYSIGTDWYLGGTPIFGDCAVQSPIAQDPTYAFWYVYTATFTGTVEITSCVSNGASDADTYVKVFEGACDPSACIVGDGDYQCYPNWWMASRVVFEVTAGQQYYIQWDDTWMPNWPQPFQWRINSCESTVSGTAFFDLNLNGTRDTLEPHFQGLLLLDGQPASFGGSDPFTTCSPYGEHVLSLADLPTYHMAVPASHTYTTSELEPMVLDLDFALQPIPGILDGAVHLYGISPWIGNNTSAWLHYNNVGTEAIDPVVELQLDPLLEFVSASIPPSSISGNTISWDLETLQPYEQGSIELTIHTPPSVAWNTEVTNVASLILDGTDEDEANNFDEWTPLVVAAYDPNDKQVTTEILTPNEVAEGTRLGYTIRFQNTGNAPAVNVVIRDTLDAGLDLSTFEMIGASHDHVISFNGHEIVWLFPNIMLPDSTTDFDGSIGTFHYRIAMREDMLLGDQVQNEAHIFFDFADPIVTNTVTTTVSIPQVIGDPGVVSDILCHPVPTSGVFNIRWLGEQITDARIVIADGVGKEVKRIGPVQLQYAQDLQVDMSGYSNGSYLISIIGNNKVGRGRIILRQ